MPEIDDEVEVPTDQTPAAEVPEPSAEDAEEDAAFNAGFESDGPSIPTGDTPPPVGDGLPAEPPSAPAPSQKALTQEEYEALMAKSQQVETLAAAVEQLRSTTFGRIGGIERTLSEKQAQTPAGQVMQLTAEDFAEMQKDFPDLVTHTVAGFNRMLSRVGVKGTGDTDEAFTKKVDTLVAERVKTDLDKTKREIILDVMTGIREDWEQVVTSNEYNTWLAAQPADYRQKVADSWSPGVVLKSIRQFETSKKPAPKAPAAVPTPQPAQPRNRRMATAVAPRSSGAGTPAGVLTEDDAFNEGWKSGAVRR